LLAQYAPANPQEEMLVHQIAEHHWRLLRARTMETGMFDAALEEFSDEYGEDVSKNEPLSYGSILATGLSRFDKQFSKLSRYETSAERSYYRAIRELTKFQKARKLEGGPADPNTEEIRFVPQKPESDAQQPPTSEIGSDPQEPPQIRSVLKNSRNYTSRDMQAAHMSMSDPEFNELTAPARPSVSSEGEK
jgi:hypothetical protein